MRMEKLVVFYIRESTGSKEQLNALEQQRWRANKLNPDMIIEDIDKRNNFDRKGLNDLAQLVKQGRVKKIIITRMDRLGAGVVDGTNWINMCQEHGVTIEALDEHIDTSSPNGMACVQSNLAWAEAWLKQNAQKVKDGHAYRKAQKKPYRACFGYRVSDDDTTLVFNDREYEQTGFSCYEIATKLVERFLEIKTYMGTLRSFKEEYGVCPFTTSGGFSRWLVNGQLRGMLIYADSEGIKEVVDRDRYPRIISEQQWNEISYVLANIKGKSKNYYRQSKNQPRKTPLGTGMIFCSVCRKSSGMIISSKTTNKYDKYRYHCKTRKRDKNSCSNSKTVSLTEVINAVNNRLIEEAERVSLELQEEKQHDRLSEEEVKLQSDLQGLESLGSDNDFVRKAIEEIRRQLDILANERISKVKSEAIARMEFLERTQRLKKKEAYDLLAEQLTPAELRSFYECFVDRIVFAPDGNIEVILRF